MPTEHMNYALAVQQVKAKSLRLTPLVAPPRASGTMPCLAWATSPRTGRTQRDIRPINPQDQHRAAKAPGSDLRNASINLVTRGRYLQHTQPLGHRVPQGDAACT